MDYSTYQFLKTVENSKTSGSIDESPCYRGFLEHTHNFHLPYRYFGNRLMYICARCVGIYGGLLVWIFLLSWYLPIIMWLQSLTTSEILCTCFILTLPLVLDWWLQCLAIKHSLNSVRLITGLLTSFSGFILIVTPQLYWLTVPCALIWMKTVKLVGIRWKRKRNPDWGCEACRGEVPKAKRIVKIFEGDGIDKY
jgi:uncharacterized membrane protein